jgi:hypothetical protein
MKWQEMRRCKVCGCSIKRKWGENGAWIHECYHGPFGHKTVHAPIPATSEGEK